MSDKEGVKLSMLAGGITPEAYRKLEESLWKSYGSKESWEEVKGMRKELRGQERQLAEQEKEIEELRERVAELAGENAILLQEFTERKDKIN